VINSHHFLTPQESTYKGKVYALTSAYCFSACDTFVSALQENKLATIVGEGTGGGTGTPHVFELPISGLRFRYSVAQGLTAVKKTFIEGVGTLPDITIIPTIEERIAGEDQQLLKIINLVAESINEATINMQDLQDSGIKSKAPLGDSYSIIDYDREVKQSMNQ
jgi:C-terminal processing protease CtpA/Prc